MQRAVTLANRSNMVMHKQITCLNKRVNASEKQLRDHIKQQKKQYVLKGAVEEDKEFLKNCGLRTNPPEPYAFVSVPSVSEEVGEVFTRLMASSGRDAYNMFETLPSEDFSRVFDLLSAEILKQREPKLDLTPS